MSKAFASNDSEDSDDSPLGKASVLPPGTPNYITPAGAEKLTAERERLIAEKTAIGDAVEKQRRRKAIDARLLVLTDRLNTAQVVNPANQPSDRVQFGATVVVRDSKGKGQTWRIVGIDEIDLHRGSISWISPLAKALIDKKVGDTATVGDQNVRILAIKYE